MLLWVNAAGGGWLDCSATLTNFLTKVGKSDLAKPPKSGYKTKYRFYPFRTFLGTETDLKKIKEALTLIEGLVDDQGENDGGQ
jgi:hypothetical protein